MKNWVILIIGFLIIFDIFVWIEIFSGAPNRNTEIYFLDVGQGDSEMVILPNRVKVLMDGGPNNQVLNELSEILRPTDRYIDLVMLSHPQLDHFGGLIDVLKRYQIGAFIYNGREGTAKAWQELTKTLKENKIPAIVLAAGDKIHYLDNRFDVLLPNQNLVQSKELNDTALVALLNSQNIKTLFTGDISVKTEKLLTSSFNQILSNVDILKVAHHGSKYSSGEEFLKFVSPKLAAIGVGARNTYGHPTKEVLNRLNAAGAKIFRTDQDGTVKLIIDDGKISIFKRKF